ncbi:unnamed protein product [Notodromas monacha]|uniref:Molybdate-anion transporter n=1 Tax=Notodromas monacha TaxID=399045 RepID=A0A7R9BW96_9CRUS|nr:unnamed protein product [Notodromas monacha]CAG0921806.1 unnamed protein product [Notodromas monacha]
MLSAGAPPLGFVFAAYMVCVMLGSSVFRIGFSDGLSKSSDALQLAGVLLCVSTAVTSVIEGDYLFTFSTEIKYTAAFFMFLLLEISVGIYFPAISTLRSHVVPESHRAGIMNWFRVPMNIVTCFSLILAKKSNAHKVFAGCALLAVLCILAARSLHRRLFGKQYSPLPEAIEVKESA